MDTSGLNVRFWDIYGHADPNEFTLSGEADESLRALLLQHLGDPPEQTVYQLRSQGSWYTVDAGALLGPALFTFGPEAVDIDHGRRGGDGFFIPLSAVLRTGLRAAQLSRQVILEAAWRSEREAVQSWMRSGRQRVPHELREFIYSEPRQWEPHLIEQLGQPQSVVIDLLLNVGYRHYVADEWWNPEVPEAPFGDPRI